MRPIILFDNLVYLRVQKSWRKERRGQVLIHQCFRPKTISPGPTLRSDRDKWGMGVRHALFPEPALGAPSRGCRLPDAILHGKRSYRPRSRAVRRFAARGFLSEAFQLASAGGCATGLRTRSRHACEFHSRLNHWLRVSHRFWRCVRPEPRVSPLRSQVAFYLTVQRCRF